MPHTVRPSYRPSRIADLLSLLVISAIVPGVALAQGGSPDDARPAAAPALLIPREAPAGQKTLPSSRFFEVDSVAFDAWEPQPDSALLLTGIPLPGGGRAVARVTRFVLVQGDARFLVDDARQVTPPRHILLSGGIEGEPGSRVYLAVFRRALFGYVERASGERAVYAPVDPGSALCAVTAETDMPRSTPPPVCRAEELDQYGEALKRMLPPSTQPPLRKGGATAQSSATQSAATRLNIALECDNDYYQLNGSSVSAATNYAIALLGGVGDIYRRDANIALYISYLNVWTSTGPYPGPAADSVLFQLRRYWIANHASIPRAVVLMLDGPHIGGGLAYVDILCNNDWGYSVSGLSGAYFFPPSGYIWDIDVVSHESGHNIGSPHTHNCWWNPAVDSCVAAEGGSCYPAPNVVHGTIMSYCHITSGGTELQFHPRVSPYLKSKADAASCSISQLVPDVDAGPTRSVCSGAPVMIGNPAGSGTPPYAYLWWPATGLSDATAAQPLASPGSATLYHVRATDANGFRAYDSVLVTIAQAPSAEAGPDRTYCSGPGVVIGGSPAAAAGTPPYAYAWTPAAGLSTAAVANPLAAPSHATTYVLLVTDANGCTARDSVLVGTGNPPVVDAGQDQTICNGTSVAIGNPASGGLPPYAYAWTPSAGLSNAAAASPTASPTASTMYTVMVTDANSCTAADSVVVTVITQSNASLTWTGAVSTDWNTRGNWDQPCALPGTGSTITIPPGTASPVNVPSIALGSLLLDNGQLLELRQAMTVTGTLELRAGNILLEGADLTVGPAGSISGDSTNFIITSGNGCLRQAGLGAGGRAGNVVFPVGPAPGSYSPVELQNGGVPDLFSVRVETPARTRGGAGTPLTANAVNLVWHVDESQLGGSSAILGLQWRGADELPQFDRAHCFIARYNGYDWLPQSSPGAASGRDPYERSAAGVTYLGTFGVGDAQSLYPVEWLSFTAVPLERGILLLWTTAGERDNAGFAIERQERDAGWNTIGFVAAAGTDGDASYRFEDAAPPDGRVAYRLRQTDAGGAQTYSPEVIVEHRTVTPPAAALIVSPHPVTADAVMTLTLPAEGAVTLDLWDALGRRVARMLDADWLHAGTHVLPFTRGRIPAGRYMLRLVTERGISGWSVLLR